MLNKETTPHGINIFKHPNQHLVTQLLNRNVATIVPRPSQHYQKNVLRYLKIKSTQQALALYSIRSLHTLLTRKEKIKIKKYPPKFWHDDVRWCLGERSKIKINFTCQLTENEKLIIPRCKIATTKTHQIKNPSIGIKKKTTGTFTWKKKKTKIVVKTTKKMAQRKHWRNFQVKILEFTRINATSLFNSLNFSLRLN